MFRHPASRSLSPVFRFPGPRSRHLVATCILLCAVLPVLAQQATLAPPRQVADGVRLYRLADPDLLSPRAPIAVQALRLDPRKVTLEIRRGHDGTRETVAAMAARSPGTIAAVNGGFFSLQDGRPTAMLKVNGELLNGSRRARGGVGILERDGRTSLLFDRLIVRTREGTATYTPLLGTSADDWARAPHAVSGAGLLLLDGRELNDWFIEQVSEGFDTTRHPRTMIGVDGDGAIWLVTVDGRNPFLSVGMTFVELQRLARRLGLRSALNLDGGGSTTMWVAGEIVNHPSDPAGPRPVSDAILVVPRAR